MGKDLAKINDILMNTHSGRTFSVVGINIDKGVYILDEDGADEYIELNFEELDDIYWSNISYLDKLPPISEGEVIF